MNQTNCYVSLINYLENTVQFDATVKFCITGILYRHLLFAIFAPTMIVPNIASIK